MVRASYKVEFDVNEMKPELDELDLELATEQLDESLGVPSNDPQQPAYSAAQPESAEDDVLP